MTFSTSAFVICAIAAMHLFQALMMLVYPLSSGATPMLALIGVFHLLHAPDRADFVSGVLILTAISAVCGAVLSLGRIRLALFIPQHLLLAIQAGGAVWAVILGSYLDGTIIPRPHIAADQVFVALAFSIHFHAILRRSR